MCKSKGLTKPEGEVKASKRRVIYGEIPSARVTSCRSGFGRVDPAAVPHTYAQAQTPGSRFALVLGLCCEHCGACML